MNITILATESYRLTKMRCFTCFAREDFYIDNSYRISILKSAILKCLINLDSAYHLKNKCTTAWENDFSQYFKWNTLSNTDWNYIIFQHLERYCKYIDRRKNKMSSNLVGIGKPAGEVNEQKNNSLSQIIPETEKGGFGIQVAQIRILLGQTQNSFAKMLLTTRQSIVALEKCNDAEDLSDGMLFRVYYLAKEVSENVNAANLLISVSKEVLSLTRKCIEDKVNS